MRIYKSHDRRSRSPGGPGAPSPAPPPPDSVNPASLPPELLLVQSHHKSLGANKIHPQVLLLSQRTTAGAKLVLAISHGLCPC